MRDPDLYKTYKVTIKKIGGTGGRDDSDNDTNTNF